MMARMRAAEIRPSAPSPPREARLPTLDLLFPPLLFLFVPSFAGFAGVFFLGVLLGVLLGVFWGVFVFFGLGWSGSVSTGVVRPLSGPSSTVDILTGGGATKP